MDAETRQLLEDIRSLLKNSSEKVDAHGELVERRFDDLDDKLFTDNPPPKPPSPTPARRRRLRRSTRPSRTSILLLTLTPLCRPFRPRPNRISTHSVPCPSPRRTTASGTYSCANG